MSDSNPLVRNPQCKAHSKRTGKRCQRPAMDGKEVCYHHGGKTPSGVALPQTKHGRYSKHLPTRLGERYEAALKDPDLLALRDEIALTDADISRLLAQVEEDEPEHETKTAREDWQRDQRRIRNNIHELIENRRRLVETERKRLVDMQQMMTAEQAMMLLAAVESVIRKHVDDRNTLANIGADIARLLDHGTR